MVTRAYSICRTCAAVYPADLACPACAGDRQAAAAIAQATAHAVELAPPMAPARRGFPAAIGILLTLAIALGAAVAAAAGAAMGSGGAAASGATAASPEASR